MGRDWTENEVDLTIADYMSMLLAERAGDDYFKAEHRRNLIERLEDRSAGAVEFKHQNISAVLNDLGHEWVPGYKPAANCQALLRDRVEPYLAANPDIADELAEAPAPRPQPLNFYVEAFRLIQASPESLCVGRCAR